MKAPGAEPRLGLIVNPRARAVRRRYWRKDRFWESLLPPERVRVAGSEEELGEALRDFHRQGINVLGTLGGDGTMSRVYNRLERYWGKEWPILLALPAGTMNVVHKSLGLGADPRRLLVQYLKMEKQLQLEQLPLRRLRVLKVSDRHLDADILAFSLVTGFVFRSLEEYYQNPAPGWFDILRAGLMPLLWVWSPSRRAREYFRPVPARLVIDGKPLDWKEVSLVVASTRKQLALWYSPFPPQVAQEDGFLCLANSMSRGQLLSHLPALLTGRYQGPGHFAGKVRRLELEIAIGYSVDGEVFHHQEARLSLESGPELRFVCPAESAG